MEELSEKNKALKTLNNKIIKIKSEIDNKTVYFNRITEQKALLIQKINELSIATSEVRLRLGNSYSDKLYWDNIDTKETQETTPWYSDKLKTLQSELFISAMNVNETFVLAANKPSGCLISSLDVFFSYLKGDVILKEEEIIALWNVFWLVIPVTSTTFASIPRMFKGLGAESIPWLFIDEAGQAVPQAAVGAIWRSKRVVVVGDPFQIEPVVTTPQVITDNIAEYFKLTKDNIHSSLSVQSMSDRANKYGRIINNTWVGSPLRIHRRCIDPMFSIANAIAYEGIMYNATVSKNIDTKLQTEFIHVEGKVSTGKHYVSNQGDKIEDILIKEIISSYRRGYKELYRSRFSMYQ